MSLQVNVEDLGGGEEGERGCRGQMEVMARWLHFVAEVRVRARPDGAGSVTVSRRRN